MFRAIEDRFEARPRLLDDPNNIAPNLRAYIGGFSDALATWPPIRASPATSRIGSFRALVGEEQRMVLRRTYEDGIPPLGGVTAFCERLVFSDPSPGDACDDFRGVATFQSWERIA